MKRRISIVTTILLVLIILILATFFRTYNFAATGAEVDEVSNYYVAESVYEYGIPETKGELGQPPQEYFYNPPIGYGLMALWFRLTQSDNITTARFYSITVSLIVLLLVFLMVRSMAGLGAALLATLFLSFDGWVVMINRMNYLENFQLILLVVGVWCWHSALQEKQGVIKWYAAGTALGLAIVYKHIGIYIAIAIALAFLIGDKKKKFGYLLMGLTIGNIVAIYLLTMYLIYGMAYFDQQLVQLNRLLGTSSSLGMNFGLRETISVIIDRYWIYLSTVLVLVVGWPFITWRYFHQLITDRHGQHLFLAWAMGGMIFALLSKLKSPHYLILWLVPLYIFLAIELVKWSRGRRLLIMPALLGLYFAAAIFTWNYRFVQIKGDALREAAAYIEQKLPQESVIATETYLGFLVPQEYTRIDLISDDYGLRNVNYLAIYQSSTYQISNLSPAIQQVYANCLPLAVFKGFKDTVTICPVSLKEN